MTRWGDAWQVVNYSFHGSNDVERRYLIIDRNDNNDYEALRIFFCRLNVTASFYSIFNTTGWKRDNLVDNVCVAS